MIENPVKIVKIKNYTVYKDFKIGSDSCMLEKIASLDYNIPVPICPWHWILTERIDYYPFKRPYAVCNCINCQAKTIYDSNADKLSRCQNIYYLMPVLKRESVLNNIEKWTFSLEEVPTSCICSILINPFLL